MKFLSKTLAVIGILLITSQLHAQKKMKFGKPAQEEFDMEICPIDSNASAVVLSDIGTCKFRITEKRDYIDYNRHVRLKIFNSESFNKGTFTIWLYKNDNGVSQDVTKLKGYVFNEVNGVWEKTKLEREHIHRDEHDKNHDVVKVTFPNIKEGSIIDFTYSIENPFKFKLPTWYFQSDIPTLYSEYNVHNIEFYKYKNWIGGYYHIDKTEKVSNQKFSVMISPNIHDNRKDNDVSRLYEFDAQVYHWRYVGSDIPAFKDEPYTRCEKDYYSSVHFELLSTRYPWSGTHSYTTTWKEISKDLMEHTYFGNELKNSNHLKDIADKIKQSSNEPLEQAALAYEHIQKQIAWNRSRSIYVDKTLKSAYLKKDGNTADINLNLVLLCKLLGLDTYPVLISTRDHGLIRKGQAILTQFNSVIAAVRINDNYLLMDASDKNCPYNLLPSNCLNGEGRLINGLEGYWVDLYSTIISKEQYMVNVDLVEESFFSGTLTYKATNYSAADCRREYYEQESEEEFIKEFEQSLGNVKISDFAIKNLDSVGKPILITANVKFEEPINGINDLLFFTPKLVNRSEENIFKLEKREYPVDYNYPYTEMVSVNIGLPDNYKIDEIPEKQVLGLPDKSGKYTYMVNVLGNKMQLMSKLSINRTIFTGLEYDGLKKFYELMVGKEAEQVVVKIQ